MTNKKDEKRFIITKDSKTDIITYEQYQTIKGYSFKPKQRLTKQTLLNVSELVVINPSLIKKLIDKKCKKTLEKIIKMISIMDDDDTSDGSAVLDLIDHFQMLIDSKYKEYMDPKEVKMLLKKLNILKSEVNLRLSLSKDLEMEYQSRKGR